MSITLGVPEVKELKPRITVFGVGGAGGNAVANMIRSELQGVDFVIANTDAQAMAQNPCPRRIQLGIAVTQGLGAGSRPEIGAAAAEESIEEIREHLTGAHMVFITAGMGGGTGTGAAPIIARAARENGMLTVGVITKPFQFEGARRMRIAEQGIAELQQFVDTLIIIPNQNLFRIANEKTTFAQAFAMADEVLHSGVRGITDLMVMPGLINLDFADIRTVMNEMGKAMMGTGEAQGDNRAVEAAEAAISNPLLDEVSMKGAKGVLIHITGGMDLTLFEVDEAANRIRSEVDPDANIIVGSTFCDAIEGRMRVSVVATGIEADLRRTENSDEQASRAPRVRPLSSSVPQMTVPLASAAQPINPVNSQLRNLAEKIQSPPSTEPVEKEERSEPRPKEAVAVAAARDATVATLHTRIEVQPVAAPSAAKVEIQPERRRAEPTLPAQPAVQENSRGSGEPGLLKRKRARPENFFDRMTSGRGLLASGKLKGITPSEPAAAAPSAPAAAGSPRAPRAREASADGASSDKLLQPNFDEEQLDIPAFLRRQAN